MGNILKNELVYDRKAMRLFFILIFSLLLFLSLSIFFKNKTISQNNLRKQNLNILKNLEQEYQGLEITYLQKLELLNKEHASELGFTEEKNVKFASRDGVLVRADAVASQ